MAYPNNMFNPIPQTQNQIMLVPVNGEGGAQMYPVAAGSTVALIDFDACIFWLKTTAPNGLLNKCESLSLRKSYRLRQRMGIPLRGKNFPAYRIS